MNQSTSRFRFLRFGALIGVGLAAVATHAQTPAPSPSPAATPPASDIVIVEVRKRHDYKTGNDELSFGEPKKITDFAGYNNQPFFMPDGKSVLYTSNRNQQTDIYRYDLKTGATTQVTNTPESEYSPTLMPDGKHISVVRVEADRTQRLWKFPLAGGPPTLILTDIKGVGYHLWIDDHTLALFIVGGSGKPNFLEIYDQRTGKSEFVVDSPGRIVQRIPNQNKFSFVHKISNERWEIKAFDLRTRTSSSLIAPVPGAEDYVWLPEGRLLMGKDSKLFIVTPLVNQWSQADDFAVRGISGISRMAVSPKGDRLAMVVRHAN